jgi:hypothetical protein
MDRGKVHGVGTGCEHAAADEDNKGLFHIIYFWNFEYTVPCKIKLKNYFLTDIFDISNLKQKRLR